MVSTTLTADPQLELLPVPSVAVQVYSVVPSGNAPVPTVHEALAAGSQMSLAVGRISIANGNVLDNADQIRPGATYAQRNLLLRNNGSGRFQDVGLTSGSGFALVKVSRALHAGDIDNDGDLDLLVTNNGQTADLLRNEGGNQSHALLVRTVGTRSNRDGIGAVLRLTVNGKTQLREVKAGSSYLGQSDMRVHFGLGRAARADRLEIRWPGGKTEVVENVDANQIVTIKEDAGIVDRKPFRSGISTRETPRARGASGGGR